jgi:hypothetical protein
MMTSIFLGLAKATSQFFFQITLNEMNMLLAFRPSLTGSVRGGTPPVVSCIFITNNYMDVCIII